MESKQYHISSRNNYFLGKLMTARDFFSEQQYFNSKRRLGNRFMFTPGIVAGMKIFLTDDKTFSLEPGVAIDYYGREIVVPDPCIRKLDLIEGFEKFKSKELVYLCIKYKESLGESTFSIVNQESDTNQKQFNKIYEKYELFITDQKPIESDLRIDGLFYQNIEIYKSKDLIIYGKFPKYVNPGQCIKVKIFFEKNGLGEPIYFKFKISGILFENNVSIEYNEDDTQLYDSVQKTAYLNCNAESEAMSEFIISKEDFILKIGMKSFSIDEDIKINFQVSNKSIKDNIIEKYYSTNFKKLIDDNNDKFIYLAKMKIVTNDISYIIENFKSMSENQYVLNNELIRLISEINHENLENKLKNIHNINKKIQKSKIENSEPIEKFEKVIEKDNIISGVETINLGFKPKPGKVYYSYEFVHGLGPGNISVETAIVNDENAEEEERHLLVFGDRSIFGNNEERLSIPDAQVACLVDPSKGTMRLGLRLEDRTSVQSIKIRWWAMKPIENDEEKDNLVINDDLKLIISPDSVTIKPLENIRFSAKIVGLEDQRVSWSLGENNPGKIDANGLYTAPAAEGVFEIIAQAVNYEDLTASAYIIVTNYTINKNNDDTDEQQN